MCFEERLKMLKTRVVGEYHDMLTNSNFLDGDVEELSLKISISKTVADVILNDLEQCYTDVEAILFYDKPLTAFYDKFTSEERNLLNGLLVDLDDFIVASKCHMEEIVENPQEYSETDYDKALFYTRVKEVSLSIRDEQEYDEYEDMDR